uniref:Uncharacterized protein n=1 Tax=viral metagenome TaxID=1070528 RepID=A0A6M3XTY7_9ZZZZ
MNNNWKQYKDGGEKIFDTIKELRKYADENYVENGEIFICKEEIKKSKNCKFFTTSDAEFHHREKQRFGDWFFKWKKKQTKKILDKIDLDTKDITLTRLTPHPKGNKDGGR